MTVKLIGILLVLLSVSLESIAQICLKIGAADLKIKLSFLGNLIGGSKAWIAVALVIFALEALVWTMTLYEIDVSMAFPMTSLTVVVSALLSAMLVGERVSRKRWLGICFILCGTALIGSL